MQQFDIVIVGAGTAGLTAAIYALRAGKTVLVTEGESFGGQITSSPRVENYPGISQISDLRRPCFSRTLYGVRHSLSFLFRKI